MFFTVHRFKGLFSMVTKYGSFKLFKFVLSFLLIIFIAKTSFSVTIGISQIVAHPALDMTRQGILDTLARRKDVHILVENAQGNITTAAQIAQKFVGQQVDVVIAIGTTAAQMAMNAVKGTSIPVIFATVTDPQEAHLVHNLQQPEGQVTGSSNFTALRPQLCLFKTILPQLKRLGMIYNPSELNGTVMVKKTATIAQELGIEVVTATSHTSQEVASATRRLANQVDAFFISNDNTALSAFNAIVRNATEAGLPVFVSDTALVEQGAIAALGPNQYEVGVAAGEIVLKWLEGTPIKELPVTYPRQNELYLNQTQASQIHLQLSPEVLKKATHVF
jgi:putative ABC transport system substrate-binding protein